jgi:hypothetical protein
MEKNKKILQFVTFFYDALVFDINFRDIADGDEATSRYGSGTTYR